MAIPGANRQKLRKKIADFDVFYYTFLSTDDKNDKNVVTLVEHSKTDLVSLELFDLVKYPGG